MKQTADIMGMPITAEIIDFDAAEKAIAGTFAYFREVDARFSTYKPESEISRINRRLPKSKWSDEMKLVLELCEKTKRETKGFFDIRHNGRLDPSGLVKGWAIQNAAEQLILSGIENFYIEAGGDIQARGYNSRVAPWKIGIRNPFNLNEIVKTIAVTTEGVATSGTYIRGQHIYNPYSKSAKGRTLDSTHSTLHIVSLTVVGPNIYEADRFATAAFAMGLEGIRFIESLPGFEGYMIDTSGTATYTSGFERYAYAAEN